MSDIMFISMDLEDTSKNRRQRDHDDLQNEIAGRETGRARRFLPDDARTAEGARKRRDRLAAETRLVLMLQDPVYRERYEMVSAALSTATQTTDVVLARLEEQILAAEMEFDAIQERAARLPDGTRVYRDAQGAVRREDGSAVDDTLAATIIWRGNEPSFEAFMAARDHLTELEADRDEVTDYQNNVLGPANDRITDEDNPPSLDDLDDILNDIDAKMPDVLLQTQPAPTDPSPARTDPTQIALPNLKQSP
ncbi:MAG: hypothetical protein AAGG47_20800 [Pseudomonadota bacterium]